MILCDVDIKNLINKQLPKIEPLNVADIRESSIQLHLGQKLLKYKSEAIDIKLPDKIEYEEILLSENGYEMQPNEFLLGSTYEKVTIPNGYMGWIETRGSIARIGLQMHLCDAHIDPGSSLNITLQLKNNANHKVKIYSQLYVIKLYLMKMSGDSSEIYNGDFQNQTSANVPSFNQDL